ncbi:hypothetical protein SB748_11690 [Rhizobium sp. SIMBA_035]|jgi:hypothetical protein
MRRLISITSIVLLIAAPAFAQSSMGVDTNGRFDGSPPPGTSPAYDAQQSGLEIPLDPIETGGITILRPSSWRAPCERDSTHQTRRDGTVNAACPDRTN